MLLPFHLEADENAAVERAVALNFGFPKELQMGGTTEQLKRFSLIGSAETIRRRIGEYVEAGCRTFVLSPMEKGKQTYQEQVEMLAAEILHRVG